MTLTEQLTLKPYRESDQPSLIGLLTDDSIRDTYMLPDFTAPADAAAMFWRLLAYSHSAEHYERGIYLGERLIGFVNDVAINERHIEIGYVIHPAHQNRGYATHALRAALADFFQLGIDEVSATAFSENTASRRVMEKCGLKQSEKSGSIPYRGVLRGCVLYSISKPEST